MQKNVSSQKLVVYAFDSTTNLPKTGDAANLTGYVSKDYGSVTVLGDTSATEMDSANAKGYYLFDLTQAETNADTLMFSAKSSTANIVVLAMPAVVFTTPPNFNAMVISSVGLVSTQVTLSGTASAGAAGTLTLTGGVATNDYYNGQTVIITGGTGIGQAREVASYVGSTKVATMDRNWTTTPDNTSVFVVIGTDLLQSTFPTNFSLLAIDANGNITPITADQGTAQAGASGSITLRSGANATNDFYKESVVSIVSGTGAGQSRVITAYVGSSKVATVDQNWATNPDNTSVYRVWFGEQLNTGSGGSSLFMS